MSDLFKAAAVICLFFSPLFIYDILKRHRSYGWEYKRSMYEELIGVLIILYLVSLIIANPLVNRHKIHITPEEDVLYRQEEQWHNRR
jgi:hypothetical protein